MTDFEEMRAFRAYVADPDQAAVARAHEAVAEAVARGARRRPRFVRRAALVAAVGVAATLVVALQPASDHGGSSTGPSLDPASAAQVRHRVVAAIDGADGILHEQTRTTFLASGESIASEKWSDLQNPDSFRTREDRRAWSGPRSGVTVSDAGQVLRAADDLLSRRVIDGRCTELVLHSRGALAPARTRWTRCAMTSAPTGSKLWAPK